MTSYLRVGYRCIQDYPNRICVGCTSGCSEPVFVENDSPIVMKDGRVLTDADVEALADEAERGYDVSHLTETDGRRCCSEPLDRHRRLWLDRCMQAMSFREAMEIASEPKSRFFFGSPCRFIARCDFTCHLLIPALLRAGDLAQQSAWDKGRAFVAQQLNRTSPRWQWLAQINEWSMA